MSGQRVCWSDTFQTKEIIIIYSASNLERPLLWFVANGYVFCCQMINVTAARLKLGRDVPPPFFSSLEVILQWTLKLPLPLSLVVSHG